MIGLIGIKKNIGLDIRGRLSLSPKRQHQYIKHLLEDFKEVVIISTCNRTEVYFNNSSNLNYEEILKKIFDVFDWDLSLKQYIFHVEGKEAINHLMEVVCGFHSRLLGEDQILGQIKQAYMDSLKNNGVKDKLQRLFQQALTCGKKFRTECKMYEIPVSSASIAVNKGINEGGRKFMVLGYGEMGKLTVKHLLSHNIEKLFIVVRNKAVVDDVEDSRITILDFKEKNKVINEIDCIISCTAATHTVVKYDEIHHTGEKLTIFDLAVPRDVEKEVENITRVSLYDIDLISYIDDKNKEIRKDRMNYYKYIVDESIDEYLNWVKIRELSPHIRCIKEHGNQVFMDRLETFKNKSKNLEDLKLAATLIKSTSDAYINRAIEVLKEEKLRGRDEECMNLIKRIFLNQ